MCRTSRPVRFFAVLLALGGGLGLFVLAAGAGCRIGPHHPIEAAIEAVAECPSLPLGWKTDTAALRERRRRAAQVPMSPVRDWIQQARSMCLPWTGDGPVMYPPCTCAGDMPGRQAAKSLVILRVVLLRARCQARPTGANPA